MAKSVILEARGLTRRFTGVLALSAVDFRLLAGEVHALMGQNGAGKSTLIKVLTGVYPADAGELLLNGEAVRPDSPAAAQRLGISTVYQEVNLCPNLSVAENIFAGRYPRRNALGLWRIDWPAMRARAHALLLRLNLDIDVTRLLSSYSVAVQQMVAIARALSVDARVLILDEPTSSLDEQEVARLFDVLRQLRNDGMAILFVTHFLAQMYAISDRVTVLRNGERVGEFLKADLPPAALITAMVGRELSAAIGRQAGVRDATGPAWLDARGLGRKALLDPIDIALHRGEVVGVGGLLGSGRTELARLLFGLDRSDSGEVHVEGERVRFDTPSQAIRHGLGMCPEERKHDGIVADLSVRENIVLALQARMGLWRFLSPARQQEIAARFVQALGIRTADLDTPIALLSGGNQQKVVLARWLATEPRLLILDEPTRGIDVAAKQEIMNEILALARDGMAVLFISSEMDEVVRVADRIVVLRDRRKVGELPGNSSEQAVYHLIAAET
ncbi:MAG: sugar ABC transporter ATP-binding protein [Caldimonas sp.]